MFSNGSQHEAFMDKNCEKCPFYVDYEEATEENPVCFIEEKIAESSCLERKEALESFPYEWLDENGAMARYDCRRRLGLEENPNPNRPKYEEPKKSERLGGFDALFKDLGK